MSDFVPSALRAHLDQAFNFMAAFFSVVVFWGALRVSFLRCAICPQIILAVPRWFAE